jgi:hypothetical protein
MFIGRCHNGCHRYPADASNAMGFVTDSIFVTVMRFPGESNSCIGGMPFIMALDDYRIIARTERILMRELYSAN